MDGGQKIADKRVDDGDRRRALEPVERHLRLRAAVDHAGAAQLGEMLRHGGLLQADGAHQRADRTLALGELAQDHQPARIGERAEQGGGLAGLGLEIAGFADRQRRHARLLHKLLLNKVILI